MTYVAVTVITDSAVGIVQHSSSWQMAGNCHWVGKMNDHTAEISDLYTRIVQLELLKSLGASRETTDAIEDHLALLRMRLRELQGSRVARTNA